MIGDLEGDGNVALLSTAIGEDRGGCRGGGGGRGGERGAVFFLLVQKDGRRDRDCDSDIGDSWKASAPLSSAFSFPLPLPSCADPRLSHEVAPSERPLDRRRLAFAIKSASSGSSNLYELLGLLKDCPSSFPVAGGRSGNETDAPGSLVGCLMTSIPAAGGRLTASVALPK